MRLEIADGRAGKEAGARKRRDLAGKLERLAEIGIDRDDAQLREFAPQAVRLVVQELGGNIHRHVGGQVRRGTQQDRSLGGRAAAELDQRAALGQQPRHLAGVLLEQPKLGAGRVVLRQPGDAVEQVRAGAVVEILCRQLLGIAGQSRDDVGGKCRARLRFGERKGMGYG